MKLADLLPAKVRGTIYAILLTANALEWIWDVLPPVLEGKVLATVNVLGFGMALSQAKDTKPVDPDHIPGAYRVGD